MLGRTADPAGQNRLRAPASAAGARHEGVDGKVASRLWKTVYRGGASGRRAQPHKSQLNIPSVVRNPWGLAGFAGAFLPFLESPPLIESRVYTMPSPQSRCVFNPTPCDQQISGLQDIRGDTVWTPLISCDAHFPVELVRLHPPSAL